jgi:hypothetical protein
MKSFRTLTFISLFLLTLLYACSDDASENPGPDEPDVVTPDLSVKVTSSVSGYVVDEAGEPVPFAEVKAGSKQTLTDEYGYFKISNVSLPEIAGHVAVSQAGYFDGYKTFQPTEGEETFVKFTLLTKSAVGTVSGSAGGSATLPNGGTIMLPANGVVNAESGEVYTEAVTVYARAINPGNEDNLFFDRPGDGRGIDADGHLKALKPFSTIAVELTTSGGQRLQIKEGTAALVKLPIPASLAVNAPSEIALWSLDVTTGLWKQEGFVTKNGDNYEGIVTHFSFWTGAEGLSLVNFTARVVNAASQPLAHVPVTINFQGLSKNAGHGRFGFTDANGYVTGAVFANADLVLDIVTPCATSAYSHEFSTSNVDTDLGTLTGNLGQSLVTISGTARNCEDQPITNGYVQVYDNGFYNRIPVVNGSFSFTGLACTNTTVSIVVVDNATNEQNTPQSRDLVPGANNLGQLVACGTSTLGMITYTVGEDTFTIEEPADTLAAFSGTGGTPNPINFVQFVVLSGDQNGSQTISFQMVQDPQKGTDYGVTDVFAAGFPTGRAYWPVPVVVNITEYGNVGGFIAGSFASKMIGLDAEGDATEVYDFTCSFRVRRRH